MIDLDLDLAKKLSLNYKDGLPFPHIIFDNFISNEALLNSICEEINNHKDWDFDPSTVRGGQQVLKFFSPYNRASVKTLPQNTKLLLDWFNSPTFLEWLTNLTGIPNLIGDPNFVGGGIHKISRGGTLSIHTDYGLHPWETRLHRRLNLLLYLNKEWEPSWGGSLQLYDFKTKQQVHSVEPIFNRAIIFNTSPEALHGHPDILACPEHRHRMSLALYYFTLEAPALTDGSTCAIWYDLGR